jgi:predicted metal-binding protein
MSLRQAIDFYINSAAQFSCGGAAGICEFETILALSWHINHDRTEVMHFSSSTFQKSSKLCCFVAISFNNDVVF